ASGDKRVLEWRHIRASGTDGEVASKGGRRNDRSGRNSRGAAREGSAHVCDRRCVCTERGEEREDRLDLGVSKRCLCGGREGEHGYCHCKSYCYSRDLGDRGGSGSHGVGK